LAEVQEVEVVKQIPPEKEYAKNFDQLYILFDYPECGEDIVELFKLQ
jgi:hypothetical protein